MNVSNFAEVGQMRSRRGTSMKTIRSELALGRVSWGPRLRNEGTYTQRAPNRIIMETWKRFEIPTAKQRNMQITPVLCCPHCQLPSKNGECAEPFSWSSTAIMQTVTCLPIWLSPLAVSLQHVLTWTASKSDGVGARNAESKKLFAYHWP